MRKLFFDSYGLRPWAFIVSIVLIGVLLLGGLIVGIAEWDRHVTERNCDRFAEQTGYVTDFKSLSYFDYACYVETEDGWVTRDRIVGVEN